MFFFSFVHFVSPHSIVWIGVTFFRLFLFSLYFHLYIQTMNPTFRMASIGQKVSVQATKVVRNKIINKKKK